MNDNIIPFPPAATASGPDLSGKAVELMRQRGIDNPVEHLAFLTAPKIVETCGWFDQQRNVGPGLLSKTIRDGGKSLQRSSQQREQDYGDQICDWLREHFPDLTDPQGWPHPKAIVAVIHLHHEHGKGSLTPELHGKRIRDAVALFEARAA